MNEQAFRALIDLVQFDQSVQEVKNNIASISEEIIVLRDQEQTLNNELNQAKQQMVDARKLVDELELEMKDLDQNEQRAKERLDSAASQKEFAALQSEIDQLKQAQHDLERSVLDAWNKRESAEKNFDTIQKDIEAKISEITKIMQEKEQAVTALQASLSERDKERLAKAELVPEEWLEKYASMGTRVDNPVVPITDGSCSGCFYHLPNQDLLRLKRGALLQCKRCFRFLYAPESMEQVG
jgi:predicted  nucleic acid-binding Zn-ribbon protein